MTRNLRWMLSAALLLAALAARAQDRGTVTTLPRPTGPYWLTSDTQPAPLLLPAQVPAEPPPAHGAYRARKVVSVTGCPSGPVAVTTASRPSLVGTLPIDCWVATTLAE